MNFFIFSLLDDMAKQNISFFCHLNLVKSAVFFSDLQELSIQLKTVADYYFHFLKKLELLPREAIKQEHICHYNKLDLIARSRTVDQILHKLNHKPAFSNEVLPFNLRYTDEDNMHLVVGIAHEEDNDGFLHAIDLHLPKKLINNVPSNVMYVKDILDSYSMSEKQTVKEFIEKKGYTYSQFQRDCKLCFGDAFYSFRLKKNMMEAVGDIIFTNLSLKEVAFKNKFLDYANMYKTFVRYGLNLTSVPRLANL